MSTTLICSKCLIERELPDLYWIRETMSAVCRDSLACEIVQFMQEKGKQVTTSESSNPEQYISRAKELVADEFNDRFPAVKGSAGPSEFYVVWFAKTLGNWKALVSTDLIPGQYWEVTHNGAKRETYVDSYVKHNNRAVPDPIPNLHIV